VSDWQYKINVGRAFDPGGFPEHADRAEPARSDQAFLVHRDRVVKILRGSRWLRDSQYSMELGDLIDSLAVTETILEFDEIFAMIYDLADDDLCWIKDGS
jgi:hypothetical protein